MKLKSVSLQCKYSVAPYGQKTDNRAAEKTWNVCMPVHYGELRDTRRKTRNEIRRVIFVGKGWGGKYKEESITKGSKMDNIWRNV